ncbi:TonB-dependent receptor [Caulobacter sp. KR2-114]|uniref:TonB-dependent receptor n=1 Tax=Caulobacter sp. KR2-114 TaxID=3400912 RepID=UPI003C10E9A6
MKVTTASILALAWAGAATVVAPGRAAAADAETSAGSTTQIGEIVVTAQKREQTIQTVGMSIQAASGDALVQRGVNSTGDLVKLVPGLTASDTGYSGAPQFGIRGVIYLDPSLAANPTVSTYNDQVPLPFSIEALGSTLDLERVEVLKGPQGTLFGDNATGGGINYIAAKPTKTFQAGTDVQYGRFNTLDAQGFLSGPVSSTLDARIAVRTVQANGWQKSYVTPGLTLGARNFWTGRLTLNWTPTSRLRVVGTLSGFVDHSQSTAPQFEGYAPLSPVPASANIQNFPIAPANAQAAAWSPCVNDAPFNNHCVGYRRNNRFYLASIRADYDLGGDITLTSLTSYERFLQYQPLNQDGTIYQDAQTINTGHLGTTYQEFRLSGRILGHGAWIVGVNYQNDDIAEKSNLTAPDSSAAHIIPAIGINSTAAIDAHTYAVFAHGELPVTSNLTVEAGIRYTRSNQDFVGCQRDNGNGILAAFYNAAFGTHDVAGGCTTLHESAAGITSVQVVSKLDEDNVSFRVGANWKVARDVMLYANISQGYKAGAYSGLSATSDFQYDPAVQEKLLAYEVGFKSELFNRTLQLNGAGFYYDYTNKQIQGDERDVIFGALAKLVNVPKSHVEGFEVSAIWRPVAGLTLTPVVSYAHSRIDGNFTQYNYLAQLQNFTGERFPGVAELQADVDAQYAWDFSDSVRGFVGVNVNYQGSSNSALGDLPRTRLPSYTLVDLRAGIEKGPIRVQVWGKNVFNRYYYTAQIHSLDTYIRYAGMPATYGVTISYRYR